MDDTREDDDLFLEMFPRDQDLAVSPLNRKLGGEEESEISFAPVRIRIGRRPIARNLRALYEATGRKIPGELEVFLAYEMWLISHTVSVIQESGRKAINQLGYEVLYPEEPKVTILELFPETKFIKKIEGKWQTEVDLKVNGEASLPQMQVPLAGESSFLTPGASVSFSSEVSTVARLSFSVVTSIVTAIGKGDRRSEWLFTRDDFPLQGDVTMMQILLTPRRLRKVDFRARTYAVSSAGWFKLPIREESKWVDLACDLKR